MQMTLTSHGYELDTSPEKFGELRASNELLGDAEGLHRRMEEEGYLLLRGLLDREAVLAARREILERLVEAGEVDTSRPLMEAVSSGTSRRASLDGRAFAKKLRTGAALRAVLHDGPMVRFFEGFLGGPVRPFDFIWVRCVRPGGATGCHYDWVYMGRGTRHLYTAWTPIGDVPLTDGTLLLLEGSNHLEELKRTYGAIDVDRDRDNNPYGGGWYSRNPVEVQERFGGRWLTTEFQAGDLLLFTMFTMHCSLDNRSPENRIRLSTDSRYQLAAEPVDERWIGEDPIAHDRPGPVSAPRS
jgi:ectoine hydroxylase-related dioxygenase (phytanoyl-CoA dioxygenase family)